MFHDMWMTGTNVRRKRTQDVNDLASFFADRLDKQVTG